jgi:hypothetical protein
MVFYYYGYLLRLRTLSNFSWRNLARSGFFFFLCLPPFTYRKRWKNGKRCITKSREMPFINDGINEVLKWLKWWPPDSNDGRMPPMVATCLQWWLPGLNGGRTPQATPGSHALEPRLEPRLGGTPHASNGGRMPLMVATYLQW